MERKVLKMPDFDSRERDTYAKIEFVNTKNLSFSTINNPLLKVTEVYFPEYIVNHTDTA